MVRASEEGRPIDNFAEGSVSKELVVRKTFDNEGFGYHKITVEKPPRPLDEMAANIKVHSMLWENSWNPILTRFYGW